MVGINLNRRTINPDTGEYAEAYSDVNDTYYER